MRTLFLGFFLFYTFSSTAQFSSSVGKKVKEINRIENDSIRIDSLYNYSNTIFESDAVQAQKVIDFAMEEATNLKSEHHMGRGHIALSYRNIGLGNYPTALKHALAALDIFHHRKNYLQESFALSFLVDIYRVTNDLPKALVYAQQASDLSHQHIPILPARAESLGTLGIIYRSLGKTQQAIQLFDSALVTLRKSDNIDHHRYEEVRLLGNIGSISLDAKNYDRALKYFLETLTISQQLRDPGLLSNSHRALSSTYLGMNRLGESDAAAKEGLKYALESQDLEGVMNAYEILVDVTKRKGDYKNAVDYIEKRMALKDSMLSKEKSGQIIEMQTRFDTKLKDEQIKNQHNEISYNKRVNLFLCLIILLVVVAGGYIWYQQRRTSKLHKQVLAQKEQLQQLNNMQNFIFSTISHDMRTPVNSLIAFMQLLGEQEMTQNKLVAYGSELKANMAGTASLLENLLSWAKSQMQGYKPVIETFDIYPGVIETLELLSSAAREKNISIQNNIKPDTFITADINMISIVLRNLVHNAIKYTPKGGVITLGNSNVENHVLITIFDSGKGCPPEVVQNINNTENMNTAPTTPGTAQERGTGLGLLLAKTFMKQMGGDIKVASEPGNGSMFTITLPAKA